MELLLADRGLLGKRMFPLLSKLAQMEMTEFDETYFELADSGDFLKVEVKGLCYPEAEDDWDRNWLKAQVIVKAGGFSGNFPAQLMTTDFEGFKKDLEHLYDNLNGTANFNSLEDYIDIKIYGDGIGHLNAQCELRDTPGIRNKLEFEINIDQTFIPILVRQLNDIITAFPVTGSLKNRSK